MRVIPVVPVPIEEKILVKNTWQKWASTHAYTLIFLALFGIFAWLTILTLAVINVSR